MRTEAKERNNTDTDFVDQGGIVDGELKMELDLGTVAPE